jgi:hypothetical protein
MTTTIADDVIARLKDTLTSGQCVYLLERRRSRSNETAIVDFVVVTPAGAIASIGQDVAAVCGVNYDTALQGATVRRPQTAERFVDAIGATCFGADFLLTSQWL